MVDTSLGKMPKMPRKSIRAMKEEFENQRKALEKEQTEFKKQKAESEKEKAGLREVIADYEKDLTELHMKTANFKKLLELVASYEDMAELYKTTSSKREGDIQEVRTALEIANYQIGTLIDEKKELTGEVQKLKDLLAEMVKEIAGLKKKLEKYKKIEDILNNDNII